MKKKAIAFLLGMFALNVGFTPAAGAAQLLFDYVGYDYESPDPDPTQFGEIGSGYVSLGEVPVLFAPLVFNTVANEYTYVISGLTAVTRQVVGPFIIVDYAGGMLDVYEDSRTLGTPYDFGVNPPNATAPSTFVDGTHYLSGALTNFRFVFNTVDNSGSFEANYQVVGGSQLSNVPADLRSGWTFAGTTSNELNMPAGYDHQVDGQVLVEQVVPTKDKSWGALKANYR